MARALATMLLMAITLVATTLAASTMDIVDKDLSEESMWALYEHWCEHHRVAHHLGDKHQCFNVFKENARMIHECRIESMSRGGVIRLLDQIKIWHFPKFKSWNILAT